MSINGQKELSVRAGKRAEEAKGTKETKGAFGKTIGALKAMLRFYIKVWIVCMGLTIATFVLINITGMATSSANLRSIAEALFFFAACLLALISSPLMFGIGEVGRRSKIFRQWGTVLGASVTNLAIVCIAMLTVPREYFLQGSFAVFLGLAVATFTSIFWMGTSKTWLMLKVVLIFAVLGARIFAPEKTHKVWVYMLMPSQPKELQISSLEELEEQPFFITDEGGQAKPALWYSDDGRIRLYKDGEGKADPNTGLPLKPAYAGLKSDFLRQWEQERKAREAKAKKEQMEAEKKAKMRRERAVPAQNGLPAHTAARDSSLAQSVPALKTSKHSPRPADKIPARAIPPPRDYNISLQASGWRHWPVVPVRKGDVVEIQWQGGEICLSESFPPDCITPNGDVDTLARDARGIGAPPQPDMPMLALLTRVNSGKYRYVGERMSFISPDTGRLYFALNIPRLTKRHFSGGFRVSVRISPAQWMEESR